jgi:uncharacterized protein YjbJ (UPF0337 family)
MLGGERSASVARLFAEFAEDFGKAKSKANSGFLLREGFAAWNLSSLGNGLRTTRSVASTLNQRRFMKSGLRDQVEGAAKEAKGKGKEKIGKATGDPQKAAEGNVDKAMGKLQKKSGEIKRDVMRD